MKENEEKMEGESSREEERREYQQQYKVISN